MSDDAATADGSGSGSGMMVEESGKKKSEGDSEDAEKSDATEV